ncbi:hypothetical protein L2X99_12800 [Microbacterium sp. KUDC0406]|uniref:hypothetical protein n=1 Tax=Microbacterium sp. KUDC0406 TaxID=2909588 RepID=UPI001F191025|nr:hypothetical protein [Microbacterium sp. KUDC0406]UJP09307.1 hypothetical protein L2X99_12800 [Microbacterium sp. KUDC0406]
MSLRDAIAEALANLESRWLFATLIALLVFAGSFGSSLLVAAEVRAASQLHESLVERGATGFAVTSTTADGLSSVRCEQLNNVAGVDAAGARASTTQRSSSALVMRVVTPGYVKAVMPTVNSNPKVVAGDKVAASNRLVAGSRLTQEELPGETLQVSIVAPPTPRDPRASSELLLVQPPVGQAQECFVIAEDGASAGVEALLTTWFLHDGVDVSPLRPSSGSEITAQALMEARASRIVPAAVAVGCVVFLLLFWMVRISDFALYRMLGADRGAVAAQLVIEASMLLFGPAASGMAFALLASVTSTNPLITRIMLLSFGQMFCLLSLALPLGYLLLLIKSPVGLIRQGG